MKYNVNLKSNSKKRRKKNSSYKSTSFISSKKLRSKRKPKRTKSRTRRLKGSKFNVVSMLKGKGKRGKKKGSKKKSFKKTVAKVFTALAAFGFFAAVVGLIIVGIFLKEVNESLPEPGKLIDRRQDESTFILDRNGEQLYKIYADQNRVYKSLDEYPPHVVMAVLAAEDAEFYEHKGLDWVGIVRCGYLSGRKYLTDKGILCGASTISQQLVRNTLMFEAFGEDAYDRSSLINAVKRKLREMLMTMQVEQTMSKDELLEMYMNEINLGGVNYGFEAGAQSIFGKTVNELTLEEAAVLAGLIQNPTRYNPFSGSQPDKALKRKNYVLGQMLKHKDTFYDGAFAEHIELGDLEVNEEIITEAKEKEIEYSPGRIDIKAPHFVWYVKDELVSMDQFTLDQVERGGLRVYTTLDWDTQKVAEDEVRKGVNNATRYGVKNTALVAITPQNGEIVSMVGSVDYWNTDDPKVDGNVNVATSIRQMGSSFKPITYLTAFDQGYNPGTAVPDIEEFDFGYDARNWDFKYYGIMTAREALVRSRNIPALDTIQTVGIDSTIHSAEKLGITTLTNRNQYGLSLTLGAGGQKLLEHTAAYSVFANEGVKAPTTSILKVEDSKGNVLYERGKVKTERVFDQKEVYLLNWTLCDLAGYGDQLASRYFISGGRRFACGKGGTTNGPRDVTGFLYHKNLVVGVWSGNNDNSIIRNASSSAVPIPVASKFMRRAEIKQKYPSRLYTRPAGIVGGTVCKDTGLLAGPETQCPKEGTIYIQGRAPAKDNREVIQVCKDNGKIPSNPAIAQKFDLLENRVVLNYEYFNKNQRTTYQKHYSKPPYSYLFQKPEVGECDADLSQYEEGPIVEFVSPENGAAYDAGAQVEIEVNAVAINEMDYVQFMFDGSAIGQKITEEPYNMVWTIPESISDGNHNLTVEAKDKNGKSTTKTIVLAIENNIAQIDISLSSPSSGSVYELGDFPLTLEASVSGTDASQLENLYFTISKIGGESYSKTLKDSNSSDGWGVVWNDTGVGEGTYQIKVMSVDFGIESSVASVNIVE